MDKFDQNMDALQKLWQDQKLKDENMDTIIAPDSFVIKRLKAFEKLQLQINTVKIVVMMLVMGSFSWYLFKFSEPSKAVVLGLIWIVACLMIFIIIYWRKQFKANQLNFSLRTRDFIDLAINKMNEQKKIFRSIFPLLVLSLIVGLNLIYLGVLTDLSSDMRIAYHLIVSTILAGLIPIGFKIRNWKFKKENLPVINDLVNFKNEIKE
ncbi:MAG: hypothetical protein P8Y99_02135 [Calditrichaceae bacterium]